MDIKNKLYKMMISCDEATYYSNISQYKKLNLKERFSFKAHLLSCKPCGDYHKQNKILSEKIKKVSIDDFSNSKLSEEKKQDIRKEIKEHI